MNTAHIGIIHIAAKPLFTRLRGVLPVRNIFNAKAAVSGLIGTGNGYFIISTLAFYSSATAETTALKTSSSPFSSVMT